MSEQMMPEQKILAGQ